MGNEIKYQETMRDVLHLLIERARDKAGSTSPFDQGVQMGYFEAVSAIVDQLETFGVDLHDVDMDGFDPTSMLTQAKAVA